MNQAAVDVLVAAALAGRRQARGRLIDGDSRCALGFLGESLQASDANSGITVDTWIKAIYAYGIGDVRPCPEPLRDRIDCMVPVREVDVIAHLNDVHGWDLLAIARKLGPEDAA